MLLGTLGQAQSMKLGTLVQFEGLNIFRYGAIAKAPPSGHGGQFAKYGILQHISIIIKKMLCLHLCYLVHLYSLGP